MPLFTLTCLDKADVLELRLAIRPGHLAYINRFESAVKLAGPILDQVDGNPKGSFFILDVEDEERAKAFADGDPYLLAGVFGERTLHAFRMTIGAL
jgi:uncharacterized protein YciI